jgi:hypothetical protein
MALIGANRFANGKKKGRPKGALAISCAAIAQFIRRISLQSHGPFEGMRGHSRVDISA